MAELVLFSLVAAILGGGTAFFEIFSKFKNDYRRAVLHRSSCVFIVLSAVLSLVVFWILYGDKSLTWSVQTRGMVAGVGVPALLRAKIFSIETSKGENYGVGFEAFYKLFQDLLIKQIDDYLLLFRSEILRSLKTLDWQVLETEVETLIPSSRLLSEFQDIVRDKMASFGADEGKKRNYLAEFLLNNASVEFNLKVLERHAVAVPQI